MKALQAVQPRPEVIVERDQERTSACASALDKPEPMTPIRVIEQDMVPILRVDACDGRRQGVRINGLRGDPIIRCGGEDDNGRRMFRSP